MTGPLGSPAPDRPSKHDLTLAHRVRRAEVADRLAQVTKALAAADPDALLKLGPLTDILDHVDAAWNGGMAYGIQHVTGMVLGGRIGINQRRDQRG